MINNSSLTKWDRLKSKNLDTQFINEILYGLNCSPFEASAILETVYKVYDCYFETNSTLKPGQIRLQLVAIEAKPNQKLDKAKQVTVTLTLNNDDEDLAIREKDGIAALRRHKIERVCREAFDQGGLLTVEDLAYRVFNCGRRTICRDLQYFREQNISIPLRSTVKDMGRTISHKLLIIKHWAQGKEYSDIKKDTHHSLRAVQSYIDKFKRTIALANEGYDVNRIAFLLKLTPALVEQYNKIYSQIEFAEHRTQEINTFLKKSLNTTQYEEAKI